MNAKDKKQAVELYNEGWSISTICDKLGYEVTFKRIKKWRWQLNKGIQLRADRHKQPVATDEIEFEAIKDAKLLKTKKKGRKNSKKKKKTADSWKKRVFAGWADTPEQAAFRRSPAYQEWRVKVLERDKYTCQHCEQTGGRLVVHHVKTFKMHPELRIEPDNGIVLCNDCHEKLHLSRVKHPKILKMA